MESIFQDLQLKMPCECSPRSSDNLPLKECGKFVIRLSAGSQSLTQKEIWQIVLMTTEKVKQDTSIF